MPLPLDHVHDGPRDDLGAGRGRHVDLEQLERRHPYRAPVGPTRPDRGGWVLEGDGKAGEVNDAVVRLTAAEGDERAACVRIGKGMLWMITPAESFSRWGLGHPFPVPKKHQEERFRMLDEVLGRWQAHCGFDDEWRFAVK